MGEKVNMGLKKVVAIVRMEKIDPVKTALVKEGFAGMTVTPVTGAGSETRVLYWRGRKYIEHFLPKAKFEIAVDASKLNRLVELVISIARTGGAGDGIVFIEPVEEAIRIRDGQRGQVALSVGRIVEMMPRKEKGVLEELEHERA